MKILWADSPLRAQEVVDRLKGSTDWKPRTVKSLINRLVIKGALSYRQEGQLYFYYPVVDEDDCVEEETKLLINKACRGSLNLLVKNFLDRNKLSQDEIDELRRILEEKE